MNSIVKINTLGFKLSLFFLGMGFIFMGCQNIQHPEKPKDLIPEDKMVEVLIDVHLFNAAKSVNRLPLQQTGMTPHQLIYEKHAIDSVQYENSNTFYGSRLDQYDRIHIKVRDFLEKEKREIDTIIAREKRRQDSIKIVTDSLRLLRIEGLIETPKELQVLKKINSDSLN